MNRPLGDGMAFIQHSTPEQTAMTEMKRTLAFFSSLTGNSHLSSWIAASASISRKGQGLQGAVAVRDSVPWPAQSAASKALPNCLKFCSFSPARCRKLETASPSSAVSSLLLHPHSYRTSVGQKVSS